MSEAAVRAILSNYEIIFKTAGAMLGRVGESWSSPGAGDFWLGMAAYEMKEYELALEHLLESSRLAPQPETHARISLALWRLGRLDEAVQWIEKARDQQPNGTVLAHCIGTTSSFDSILAAIELERGNAGHSLEAAMRALSTNSTDALALLAKAGALFLRSDYQEAQRAAEAAHTVAPPFLRQQTSMLLQTLDGVRAANSSGTVFLAKFATLSARYAV